MLVVAPDRDDEHSTPVYDWLVVGRECAGVDERHRLLIPDPAISRTHLELRLDLDLDQAWLTDHSTNGTRLNGKRIERSIPVRIKPGDRVRLGGAELQFRSRRFAPTAQAGLNAAREVKTIREVIVADMAMVVGDILSFSTIAEHTDDRVLLENIDRLYAELRQILARHNGTLSNYVGDAFFATWETAGSPGRRPGGGELRGRGGRDGARDRGRPGRPRPGGRAAADGLGRRQRDRGGEPDDRHAGHRARRRHERGLPALRDRRPGRPARGACHRRRPPLRPGGLRLHSPGGHPGQGPLAGRRGARRQPAMKRRLAGRPCPRS